MKNIGQQIRNMRLQNNIGLNEYANELGVSSGYLSNLETGKTETINLNQLEKILKDLGIYNEKFDITSDAEQKIQRVTTLLYSLFEDSPEVFNYFVNTLENGINLFKRR